MSRTKTNKRKIKSKRNTNTNIYDGVGGSGGNVGNGGIGTNTLTNKKEKNDKTEKKESLIVYYSNTIITNNKDLTGKYEVFKNEPTVSINNAKPNRIYMITMTDPDAPNGEEETDKSKNYVYTHWVYIVSQSNKKNIVFMPYAPPTPPRGTHQYQFNLYDITNKTNDKEPANATKKLNVRDLMVLRLDKDETMNPNRRKYSDNLASFLQSLKPIFTIQYKVSATVTISSSSVSTLNSQQKKIQQQQDQIQQLQKQERNRIGLGTYLAADLGVNVLGRLLF